MSENMEDAAFLDDLLEDQDVGFFAELLESDDRPKRRVRKSLTDVRTLENWIKLQHTANRECEVPLHDAITDRPRTMGMMVIINDMAVCRMCFLAEADKE
jgi:hypothetical protein